MRNLFPLAVLLAALSCSQPESRVAARPSSAPDALLAAFQVDDDPSSLPDAQRVRLEASAVRLVAAGPSAASSILADITSNRNASRRMALLKILVLVIERTPPDNPSRKDLNSRIEAASSKLLSSDDPSDRYTGLILMAMPSKSRVVETSIRLLDDPDQKNRDLAHAVLAEMSGVDLGYRPADPPSSRKAAAGRWKEWWSKSKSRPAFYLPTSNPLYLSLSAECARIARSAGPYPLRVTTQSGEPISGAVVVHSYQFSAPDGWGDQRRDRTTTDDHGNALLGVSEASAGMRFRGGQLIISKSGYKEFAVTLGPHVLTRNSFSIDATLEPEAAE